MNPKCIQDWHDEQARKAERVNELVQVARHAEEAVERSGIGVVDLSDLMMVVQIRVTEADSFSNATPLLRELARLGYHTNKRQPFRDHHDYNMRSFPLGPIHLDVWLKADGAACRRVQVGERVEPVYKFVCDDARQLESTEAATAEAFFSVDA